MFFVCFFKKIFVGNVSDGFYYSIFSGPIYFLGIIARFVFVSEKACRFQDDDLTIGETAQKFASFGLSQFTGMHGMVSRLIGRAGVIRSVCLCVSLSFCQNS